MTIHDKYIDLFTDFGFKWIFGTEENKKFLISFLNDLLELKDKIVDLEYRSLEKLGLNFIECKDTKDIKFLVRFQKSESELSNHLEYWLYFFNNLNSLKEVPKVLKEDKVINEAFDVAQFLALDKDAQWQYQQDLKARWDNKACMDYAIETATEEGHKIGHKIGLERGLEQGAKNKQLEIAKSLLDVLDIETISIKTGLSIEENQVSKSC
jgi:hypothetical protein